MLKHVLLVYYLDNSLMYIYYRYTRTQSQCVNWYRALCVSE